mgnify:CR=1 FL=1
MKTKYKYIHFTEDKDNAAWLCMNTKHSDLLGWVDYNSGWKQHVFTAAGNDIIFSASCLDDISHFMKQLDAKK